MTYHYADGRVDVLDSGLRAGVTQGTRREINSTGENGCEIRDSIIQKKKKPPQSLAHPVTTDSPTQKKLTQKFTDV